MIFLVAILAVTLSLSIANPVAVLSSRQIPNFQCINSSVTLSGRCLDALNDYLRVANMTISTGLTPEGLSRVSGQLQSSLDVLCSSDCLDPYIRCLGNSEQVRNLTTQVYCFRAGDGNYCPVKLLQELARRQGVFVPPNCIAVSSTTCSSSCQQSYRQLRNDLDCCAATLYTNPSSPFVSHPGNNFAACNVSLGNPCSFLGTSTSTGAANIYLNLVIVLAMALVAFAMVWSMLAMVFVLLCVTRTK